MMRDQDPTDGDLVAAARGGDREAFGLFYDRHARLVRAVALAEGVEPQDARLWDVSKGVEGFYRMTAILRDNPHAVYHGKTVGPEDKDKVLLRWKSDGGLYHVLFGDLRFETMDAGRLKTLERKPAG